MRAVQPLAFLGGQVLGAASRLHRVTVAQPRRRHKKAEVCIVAPDVGTAAA